MHPNAAGIAPGPSAAHLWACASMFGICCVNTEKDKGNIMVSLLNTIASDIDDDVHSGMVNFTQR